MPPVHDDAIVLQAFAYGDTSRILRLLTRRHGVVSVMAKGARRPRSRYGGLLEPFTEGVVSLYIKDSRELQTLAGFDLTRSGQRLGDDLVRFGGASLVAEIVLSTASAQPDPELYDRVVRALRELGQRTGADLEVALLAELWGLVAHLGFAPELDRCQVCGRCVGPRDDTAFDYAAGGIRCAACPATELGRRLPANARLTLSALLRGERPTLDRTGAHWALLSRFVAYHVVEGRTLRSLEFLASALQPV
ncbi:MAG: DNA repair protein RecO [Longimicrobiales bacterium]